jgi:hypothetical protein
LGERLRYRFEREMRSWQTLFPDADPAAIDIDRGSEAMSGRYAWPPFAGKPVSPVMDSAPGGP